MKQVFERNCFFKGEGCFIFIDVKDEEIKARKGRCVMGGQGRLGIVRARIL